MRGGVVVMMTTFICSCRNNNHVVFSARTRAGCVVGVRRTGPIEADLRVYISVSHL
jgi:hypothetical protein